MARLSSLDDLERLYAARGHLSYGEGISQIEHALQCAARAQSRGAPPHLVLAALVHDVGHLLDNEQDAVERDLGHEIAGAAALEGLFGEAVCAPIALHVAAKRYLCHREPAYMARLSAASRASLALQGGPLDAAAAAAFEQRPGWREAVELRRCDDDGKREDAAARGMSDMAALLRALARSARQAP
jgi:predicted HD phosphohydrolase